MDLFLPLVLLFSYSLVLGALDLTCEIQNNIPGSIVNQARAQFPKGPVKLKIVKQSLFHHVPPYLHFSYWNESEGPPLPRPLFDALKWGISKETHWPIPEATGLQFVHPLEHPTTWVVLVNAGQNKRKSQYRIENIQNAPFQKYNILPGSEELANKKNLYYHYKRLQSQFGPSEFNFMFETYSLPEEYQKFKAEAQRCGLAQSWIVKPNTGYISKGIKIYHDWRYISKRTKDAVVQKYLRPGDQYMIQGLRVELRLFVIVTSCAPLRVYVYNKSLLKTFNRTYEWNSTLDNWGMSIQRREVHWEGKTLFATLRSEGTGEDVLEDIKSYLYDKILKVLLGTEAAVAPKCIKKLFNSFGAYQIYTFDFVFTKVLRPILIEVNIHGALWPELNPACHATVFPLLTDTLNLVGYHFPPTLSPEGIKILKESLRSTGHIGEEVTFDERLYSFHDTERDRRKRERFSEAERSKYIHKILSDLTPSDLRYLIVAEDEHHRAVGFQKLFPTRDTHQYFKYSDPNSINRYHYKLQDAWENIYGENRTGGVEFLRTFSRERFHLHS